MPFLAGQMAIKLDSKDSAALAPLIEADLELAAALQQKLFSQVSAVSFAASELRLDPAHLISGDVVLNWLSKDNFGRDYLNFFIGDVVGHGVTSALLTMVCFGSVMAPQSMPDPAEKLASMNQVLCSRSTDYYVTGAILQIRDDGQFSYTNAGHPPLVLVTKDGEQKILDSIGGIHMGMFLDAGASYKNGTERMEPQDRLFGFTDGMYELERNAGEFEKFVRDIGSFQSESLTGAADKIWESGSNADIVPLRRDDRALIAIEYRGL